MTNATIRILLLPLGVGLIASRAAAAWTAPPANEPFEGHVAMRVRRGQSAQPVTLEEHVVSVRRQEVADSDFEPPPGYERADLPPSAFSAFLPTTK